MTSSHQHGRPGVTTHEEIEEAAFALFAERGYEGTTMAAIADRVVIGRRTLFRYFPSKHDIPWGQFDRSLVEFRSHLDAAPEEFTVPEAVMAAVASFNERALSGTPGHRVRMRLILHEPSLQTHSVLRYAAWREVIAEYVAERLGGGPRDPVPQLAAYSTNAVALAAYARWVRDPDVDLRDALREAASTLRDYWQI